MKMSSLAVGALALFSTQIAFGKDPVQLQQADLAESVKIVKDASILGGGEDYVVQGTKRFDGWFLKANRLVFEPGSKLVFSRDAQNRRNSFFIVAKEIVVKDANSPGSVTWDRSSIENAPSAVGQAASGSHGQGDGENGGTGANGATGNTGYPGKNAPNLTVFVFSTPSSGPEIDFRGQDGGKGGNGLKGGDGGNGQKGQPASQDMVNCRRGGGNGGTGGAGGTGGTGGTGGNGGGGGSVTLVSIADRLPTLTQRFRLNVRGGAGGPNGNGGEGGNGGQGGPGGQEARPYCGGGSAGGNGSKGSIGSEGGRGADGLDGDVFVGSLTEQQFKEHVLQ